MIQGICGHAKSTLLYFLFFLLFPTTYTATFSRYDKSISLFSPDGELMQVKYADKAGENGPSLVCIISGGESVVLCSPAVSANSLLDRRCIDKVSQVDESIWIAFAGLLGDGRHITRKAREYCNSYQAKFGCRPTVSALAQHIGTIQHEASVKGGVRPLGLHVLCVGFDERSRNDKSAPSMFVSRSSGEVTQWTATAIGKHAEKNIIRLEDALSRSVSEQDAIKLSVEILSKTISTDEDGAEDKFDIYVLSSVKENKNKYSMTRKTVTAREALSVGLTLPETR